MKNPISRRSFLLMAGGSGAAVALKPGEKFVHKLISYVNPPTYPEPGEWAFFSTTCRECPAGCGLILWHRDGRVTKAEGNPLHPISKGNTCARGQASVQGLYNTNRLQKVLKHDQRESHVESDWAVVLTEIKNLIAEGKNVKLMSSLQTGSLMQVFEQFCSNHNTLPLVYEPYNYEAMRAAYQSITGQPSIPYYNIEGCDYILSIEADFLATWLSPVEYAGHFSDFHSFKDGEIGTLAYVGPVETLTTTNADTNIILEKKQETAFITAIMQELAKSENTEGIPSYLLEKNASAELSRPLQEKAKNMALALKQANQPIVLAGSPEDRTKAGKDMIEVAYWLNVLLGSQHRIDFSKPHALSQTATQQQIEDFKAGISEDDILFIHDCNPVYSDIGFLDAMKKAYTVVYLGANLNETAAISPYILPVHHYLEEWGDYEVRKGFLSLKQPVMHPLYKTIPAGDVFLKLMDLQHEERFKSQVRDNWAELANQPVDTENLYKEILRKGYLETQNGFSEAGNQKNMFLLQPAVLDDGMFHLQAPPSLFFYDGRLADRPWLQEIPHPISNIAWDSWVDINKQQAMEMGIAENEKVILSIPNSDQKLELPVRYNHRMARNTLYVEPGQGHWDMGTTADGIGKNVFQLTSWMPNQMPLVRIEKTGREFVPVYVHPTKEQHDREILRHVDLKELLKNQSEQAPITWPLPEGYNEERDLYEPHDHADHRWGMTIDLQKCIGCKACETACYAENNIPVVGRESVRQGKEMSWLKVAPYNISEDKQGYLPLPCQHCDAAPCEPVCPTFASVHSEEGLNAQIYNRCIGTRYCSNNCPYKVRRFNWKGMKVNAPVHMQLNPEVTVRERGVMEKCTFCVQRIRNVQYEAKKQQRSINDGEIVPACAQACPTQAIVFGDLMDENSQVKKLMKDERRYQLLHELNTKPAVVYLKRIVQAG